MITSLWTRFLEDRKNLRNATATTLVAYENAWRTWGKLLPEDPAALRQASVTDVVLALRRTELHATSINTYLKVLKCFLRWLHEEGVAPVVRVKFLIEPKLVPPTFTVEQLQRILDARPRPCLANVSG